MEASSLDFCSFEVYTHYSCLYLYFFLTNLQARSPITWLKPCADDVTYFMIELTDLHSL